MKTFTDLVQSGKLAYILPIESADMHYLDNHYDPLIPHLGVCNDLYEEYKSDKWDYIPCWSLAALLNVLPEYHLSSPNPLCNAYYCRVKDIETYADNPVNACVAMIEKLHEFKML